MTAPVMSLAACRAERGATPFEFAVTVTSDPGRPVMGAVVSYRNAPIGTTKADGTVNIAIEGSEGEVFALATTCPPDYRPPTAPLQVTLRKLGEAGRRPELTVSCPPKSRAVVIAVRAENGINLPVLYLGQEVARTDASGSAHVVLHAAPDEPFELTLLTADKNGEHFRPQNPSGKFAVKDRDEVLVFDQPFVVERAARPVVRSTRPTPLTSRR